MRNWLYGAAGALLAAGLMSASGAQAAPMSADGLRTAAQEMNLKQDVQYFYGGRRYCFYPDGWRGPGYYWCGYAWRRGFGWGGPMGWRGWGRPGPGPGFYGRPGMERREFRRERREFRRDRF